MRPKAHRFDDTLAILAEQEGDPVIEEAKLLVREDIERLRRLGEITEEQRMHYLAIIAPTTLSPSNDIRLLRN